MSDIRWVCMSDTHFGAENSLLSHLPNGSLSVDPDLASPVLESFVACLREVIRTNAGSRLPTLVLNGDILDLALSRDNVAAMVFDRFIDLAFSDPEPLFDPTIVYIPGNHDHHIWETARERQYARYVASVPKMEPIEPPWHVTRLFESESDAPATSELLSALVSRRLGSHAVVKVVYPNMGIANDDWSKLVVFHHGHFVEPLYQLMSTSKAALFPKQTPGEDIWDWESDNFAWIDFFWSTLGRSGDAGDDVGLIYDMLQDKDALGRLAANLGARVADLGPGVLRPVARPLARSLVRRFVAMMVDRERNHPSELLSDHAQTGLVEYLSSPLHRQIEREHPGASDSRVDFVFGHSHKPFAWSETYPNYSRPVSVYNTGGWVVDTEATAELQGAAVVVADGDCNLVSIRMFNQSDDPASYRAMITELANSEENALCQHLAESLDFSSAPWTTFSAAAAAAVDQRHATLPQLIQRGLQFV